MAMILSVSYNSFVKLQVKIFWQPQCDPVIMKCIIKKTALNVQTILLALFLYILVNNFSVMLGRVFLG